MKSHVKPKRMAWVTCLPPPFFSYSQSKHVFTIRSIHLTMAQTLGGMKNVIGKLGY